MLAIERPPVTEPAAAGSNVTVTVTDWFGVSVTFEPPLAAKPVPVAETLEILKFALPVFVRTTDCEDEAPTVTLPKVRLDLLAETCGADATPVPETVTLTEFELLSMESVPEAAPEAAGLNDAVKFAFWPAPSVSGVAIPEALNPLPEIARLVIVKSELPVFERVIV